MPQTANGKLDFNSAEVQQAIKDFKPDQDKDVILGKYLGLRQGTALKNGTRIAGNGFGLDISDFKPTSRFWQSKLYDILKNEIKR